MRLALCKIAHFMLPQIFSEWKPIDSTQQEAFLRAVGIAEPEQWDSLTTQWVMKWLPNQAHCLVHFPSSSLSVSLSLALSPEYSTSTESFPCSQHRGADAGWKTFLFFLHLSEKMSLCLALVGTGLLQLSSTESRYSMWVPVLNISILPDIKMPPYTFFPARVALSHVVTYPAQLLQSKKEKEKKECGKRRRIRKLFYCWMQFPLLCLFDSNAAHLSGKTTCQTGEKIHNN